VSGDIVNCRIACARAAGMPAPAPLLASLALSPVVRVVLISPLGGDDMPVVISLLIAFTGFAVGIHGHLLGSTTFSVAGMASGALRLHHAALVSTGEGSGASGFVFSSSPRADAGPR
jgi:NAD(P) transhydrogenase subunit beta